AAIRQEVKRPLRRLSGPGDVRQMQGVSRDTRGGVGADCRTVRHIRAAAHQDALRQVRRKGRGPRRGDCAITSRLPEEAAFVGSRDLADRVKLPGGSKAGVENSGITSWRKN